MTQLIEIVRSNGDRIQHHVACLIRHIVGMSTSLFWIGKMGEARLLGSVTET